MNKLESLLAEFNSRIGNTALVEYLNRTNIYETIGKARNEMVHTKMLQWLLTSGDLVTSADETPIMHFLDAVVSRDMMQSYLLDDALRQAILTRSLKINKLVSREIEYPLGTYVQKHASNCCGFNNSNQESISAKEKDRLDLYLEFEITGARRSRLEIFLENKVYSVEHDNQTERYYNVCKRPDGKGKGKESYKIFVFLTPLSSSLLEDYAALSKGENRAMCDRYIQINYQDILDSVITPLLSDTRINDRNHFCLEEYVNCLELPALPDEDMPSAPKGFSIMATSAKVKRLVDEFMSCEANRYLLNSAATASHTNKLYQVNGEQFLTENDAVALSLECFVGTKKKLDCINYLSDVIGNQGGQYPFLVYACKIDNDGIIYLPGSYFIHNGKPYCNVLAALKEIIPTYLQNTGNIEDFDCVYDGRGGGKLISTAPEKNYEECLLMDGGKCYINNSCGWHVEQINKVLVSKGLDGINAITPECYDDLVVESKYFPGYCRVPVEKYKRLGATNFYYRRWGAKINKLVEKKDLGIKEITETHNRDLLIDFCKNHKSLIIPVKKILIDEISDSDERKHEEQLLDILFERV